MKKKQEVPNWFKIIIPKKAILAITSLSIVLLTISLGGGPREVGIVIATMTAGSLFASLYWGNKIIVSRKRMVYIIFGPLGLLISIIILFFAKSFEMILVSAFLLDSLSSSTYFSSLALIAERHKRNINFFVGKFEEYGGWGWVVGLVFGFILSTFFDIRTILLILSAATLLYVFYILVVFAPRIITRYVENLLKEVGIISKLGIIKGEIFLVEKTFSGLRSIVHESFILPVAFMKAAFPKKITKIHLIFSLIFFASGLLSAQLITLMKAKDFSDNMVYGISIFASAVHALVYPKAGKVKKIKEGLLSSVALRSLTYLFIGFSSFYFGLPFIFLLIFFYLTNGYFTAYVTVLSNSFILKKWKKEIGVNIFYRSIAFVLGSFLSGLIVFHFNFFVNFAVAAIIAAAAALIYSQVKRFD